MKITSFHPSHFAALRPHLQLRTAHERATPEYLAVLAAEPSITVWISGRPMVVAGVLGECELWGHFDAEVTPHRFALFRAAKRFLSTFGWLYANVPMGFAPGCRWLEHLGFAHTRVIHLVGERYQRYERAI
jgi:hypothetical protein